MGDTLAIMVTMTTYGTWLRGDARGWVDDGRVLPADPILEANDRQRMKHPVSLFPCERLIEVGQMIGRSLRDRLSLRIAAMAVETWHLHTVVAATTHDVAAVVKCAKDAARWGLRPGRPIWSEGYDKRYCLDEASVLNRVRYVERHNLRHGLPAQPWPFIETII
jgi:hypothetical protein